MCKYFVQRYKDHFACFECRKSFKKKHWLAIRSVCPECAGKLQSMGPDFKAPKRNDIEQWQKVKLLADNGIYFHSCGCSGPGERPNRLRDVPSFLERKAKERQTPGQAFLERLDRLKAKQWRGRMGVEPTCAAPNDAQTVLKTAATTGPQPPPC